MNKTFVARRKIKVSDIFILFLLLFMVSGSSSCGNSSSQADGDFDDELEVTDGDEDIQEADNNELEDEVESETEEEEGCTTDDPCMVAYYNGETEKCETHPYCYGDNKSICVTDEDMPRCICDDGYGTDENDQCALDEIVGKNCTDAILLTPDIEIHGSPEGAVHNNRGSCKDSELMEKIYYFYVAETVKAEFWATGYDSVLYLRSTCNNQNSEVACNDNTENDKTSYLSLELEPGWYFLFVDGFRDTLNRYYLESSFQCAPGKSFDTVSGLCETDPCLSDPCTDTFRNNCKRIDDETYECLCAYGFVEEGQECIPDKDSTGINCNSPIFLAESEGTVTGTTTTALPDERPSCAEGSGTSGDIVYMFEVEEHSMFEINYKGGEGLIYIRTECSDADSEVLCDNGEGESFEVNAMIELDAGVYYLFADSYFMGDDFTFDYAIRPDPCADVTCEGETYCQRAENWSSYVCDCDEGETPFKTNCVDDPCDPNPCTEIDHRNSCKLVYGDTLETECKCNYGFISEGEGCVPDPDANKWGIFIYLNADNNLEDYGYDDLEEMVLAGSTKDVHIVVLFDSLSEDGGTTRKIYITSEGIEVLEDAGELDLGSWQTLADFGVWAVDNFPAQKTALIMWDHGSGWLKSSGDPQDMPFKSFSEDQHGNKDGILVSNGDYSSALQQIINAKGSKLDIIGFDACFMGMLEVAIASKDYGDIFIGSQETIPGEGWSYDDFLTPLVNNPAMTPVELATSIVQTYYDETDGNSTLAAMDLSKIDPLLTSLSSFADTLKLNSDEYDTLENHRIESQTVYLYGVYRDLKDFAKRVKNDLSLSVELQNSAAALELAVDEFIIMNKNQTTHPNANGVNIYFPKHDTWTSSYYIREGSPWKDLFSWDEFLLDFAGDTETSK